MAMDLDWVEGIFSKLVLVYGARFQAQWSQLPAAMVKADWAHELDGVTPAQLTHALRHLPADFPPNVLQFKQLCQEHRPTPMRALVPVKGTRMPESVKQQLARLTQDMGKPRDPLAGARSLRDKERNGILLTRAQREFWRTALGREMREESLDDGA